MQDRRGQVAERVAGAAGWCVLIALLLALCGCRRPPTHGTAFVAGVESPYELGSTEFEQAAEQVCRSLRNRLESLGVRNAVEREPEGRVIVKVPNLSEAELDVVWNVVSKPGHIEFRTVHTKKVLDDAKTWKAPSGYQDMTLETRRQFRSNSERLYVRFVPEMTGEAVKSAYVFRNASGNAEIGLDLTKPGGERFAEVTRTLMKDRESEGKPRRLAIVVDGTVWAAPVVQSEITGGKAQITGQFTDREAIELADVLNSPFPRKIGLRLIERRKF